MWPDDELVMISALEHYSYCPRQCGLIHLEDVYHENVFTLRGRKVHERAHAEGGAAEHGVRVERALPLWSEALGLTGVADVVEFHADGRVVPVAYKSGPARKADKGPAHADYQLCAQALCLEEMVGVTIPVGAVFEQASRRRREVLLSAALRERTETMIEALRAMRRSGILPPPVNDSRCPRCSLIDACVPEAVANAARRSAREVWRVHADW